MNESVIVIRFPYTEDKVKMGLVIEKAREIFSNMSDVSAHLAIDKTAERVISVLEGKYDEKLMRRAVGASKLEIVPEDN